MKDISRRDFLKIGGAAAVGAAGLAACAPGKAPAATEGEGEMEYRTSRSGDRVSLLGFGCMRWQMKPDASGVPQVDQESVNELVDYALAHGVNYFDTSPAYLMGQSEKAAGEALSRHPRESYYIATKLSNFGDASPAASAKMFEDSLEQLRTDYFDYYLLHAIGRGGYEAFKQRYEDNGMMDFLLEERRKGRIRNLGFSFHGSREEFDVLIDLDSKYHWDFVQIEMNWWDWKHADGVRNVNADYLYAELDRRELPIVVMEPLLGGRLASPPESIVGQMKQRDPDASAASWAFRFVGTYPRILTVLSGMNQMEHLVDNVRTFSGFRPLSDEELVFMEEMAGIMADFPLVNCTNCKYCMPCPWGINIPEIFAHYNKSVSEGAIVQSKEQENWRKLRRRYLVSYDRAIPTLRQASHCIACGECLSHCPQSIDIPRQLRRIDNYIEKLKKEDF